MPALVLLVLVASPETPGTVEVATAVRRGVAWLRSEQKADGSFGQNAGETALVLLALRHSRVPSSDKACTKAARYLERALPDGTVYGAALGTLALLAQSPERHKKEITGLVKQLVAGQCRNGQWSYAYRATRRKKAGDNSNTQIAILALAGARVRRFVVDKEAFERCGAYFAETQNEDGGFGYSYNQRKNSYGSMTAGGAMALALCGKDASRALAWIATDFKAGVNRRAAAAFGKKKGKRGDSFWRHYWLWSVERACSAAKQKALGVYDWYGLGARFLIDHQQDDGQWRSPERAIQATCFALLFFGRSTQVTITPRDKDRPTETPKEKSSPRD